MFVSVGLNQESVFWGVAVVGYSNYTNCYGAFRMLIVTDPVSTSWRILL